MTMAVVARYVPWVTTRMHKVQAKKNFPQVRVVVSPTDQLLNLCYHYHAVSHRGKSGKINLRWIGIRLLKIMADRRGNWSSADGWESRRWNGGRENMKLTGGWDDRRLNGGRENRGLIGGRDNMRLTGGCHDRSLAGRRNDR